MSLLIFACLLSVLLFTTPGRELSLNGQKYVAQNIDKNQGVRKSLLHLAQRLLSFLPEPDIIAINKQQSDAGAKKHHSSISTWLDNTNSIIHVNDTKSLLDGLMGAQPGNMVVLAEGTYTINQGAISLGHGGTPQAPIFVVAEALGKVEVHLNSLEGIVLNKPHWRFKNLIFRGVCVRDSRCEHAFHIVGNASFSQLENNRFVNFNAAIKANGDYSGPEAEFPDHITLNHNDFYNENVRQSSAPATPIDVVGGSFWQIRKNFIADFSRTVGTNQSVVYGAFVKGGGEGTVIEENLINCSWRLPYQSPLDVRVGLSFGNGGTFEAYCRNKDCAYEHKDGTIKNNLIVNCQHDVGIYLNKAQNTRVVDNVVLNSLGIDAHFPQTNGVVKGNTLTGRIKNRQGASMQIQDNQFQ